MADLMSVLTAFVQSSSRLKRGSPKRIVSRRSLWRRRKTVLRVEAGWKVYRMLLQVRRNLRSERQSRCRCGRFVPWQVARELT